MSGQVRVSNILSRVNQRGKIPLLKHIQILKEDSGLLLYQYSRSLLLRILNE